MRKHVVGFALFSLIVSSAVLVKALFFFPKEKKVVYTYSTKNSCWKMKQELPKTEGPLVQQAVLNLKSRQINWLVVTPAEGSRLALHFFIKDRTGNRYVGTEIAPGGFSDKSLLTFTSTYLGMLDDLDTYQNLYVIEEVLPLADHRSNGFRPVFDESRATPVLVDYENGVGGGGYGTEIPLKK